MKIILASTSPRRKNMMDLLNIKYEIIPSDYDEQLENNITMEEQSKKLAYMKAKSVFDKTKGDRIIIGADTLVVKNNKLYGKPKSKLEAKNMLTELKNTYNTIITSLAILIDNKGEITEHVDYDTVKIYLSDMTDEEIEKWIDSGEALDKAGAYTIDGNKGFSIFVNEIEGNYNTALGLPIHKLYKYIKKYI